MHFLVVVVSVVVVVGLTPAAAAAAVVAVASQRPVAPSQTHPSTDCRDQSGMISTTRSSLSISPLNMRATQSFLCHFSQGNPGDVYLHLHSATNKPNKGDSIAH